MSPRHSAPIALGAVILALMSSPPVADAASPPRQATSARGAPPPGDARRGAALYESRCSACHALDANRIGPSHRGVFGRRAGAVPGFAYTEALKRSGLTWNAASLDAWLAGPTVLAPGTAMGFRLSAPQDRADVIAYLASPPLR